jgi:hypothetical protein
MTNVDMAKIRARSEAPEMLLLRLQRAMGLSAPAFGLLTAALVFLFGVSPLAVLPLPNAAVWEVIGSSLFFAASLGIITGFLEPVLRGAERDLAELQDVLDLADEDLAMLQSALGRVGSGASWRLAAQGLVIGGLHSLVLGHFDSIMPFPVTQTAGTVLLWTAMFTTMPVLVQNAAIFSRLGASARPDLLRPSRHAAFGSAALRPALFLIGLLCAYALLGIYDSKALDDGVWIGMAASAFVLAGIVVLPLRGIRARIREERSRALATLDARFDAMSEGGVAGADEVRLAAMDTLLDMRERVARAPGWPVDLAGVRRILLYVVLPPLTWAAAAVVEMMIDDLL